jgi:hypothetical protein
MARQVCEIRDPARGHRRRRPGGPEWLAERDDHRREVGERNDVAQVVGDPALDDDQLATRPHDARFGAHDVALGTAEVANVQVGGHQRVLAGPEGTGPGRGRTGGDVDERRDRAAVEVAGPVERAGRDRHLDGDRGAVVARHEGEVEEAMEGRGRVGLTQLLDDVGREAGERMIDGFGRHAATVSFGRQAAPPPEEGGDITIGRSGVGDDLAVGPPERGPARFEAARVTTGGDVGGRGARPGAFFGPAARARRCVARCVARRRPDRTPEHRARIRAHPPALDLGATARHATAHDRNAVGDVDAPVADREPGPQRGGVARGGHDRGRARPDRRDLRGRGGAPTGQQPPRGEHGEQDACGGRPAVEGRESPSAHPSRTAQRFAHGSGT